MKLIRLSFSHQRVPIALRERLHFDNQALAVASSRFRCGEDSPASLLEFAILSTCNRTEFYVLAGDLASSPEVLRDELLLFMSQSRGIAPARLAECADWFWGPDAVFCLCREKKPCRGRISSRGRTWGTPSLTHYRI